MSQTSTGQTVALKDDVSAYLYGSNLKINRDVLFSDLL